LKFDDLKLDNIIVNDGPQYKRMRAVSRGRGHEIKKRTSHIVVTLSTVEAGKKVEAAKVASVETEVKAEPVVTPTVESSSKPKTKTSKKVTK
jgi:hypothetical protein